MRILILIAALICNNAYGAENLNWEYKTKSDNIDQSQVAWISKLASETIIAKDPDIFVEKARLIIQCDHKELILGILFPSKMFIEKDDNTAQIRVKSENCCKFASARLMTA